MTVLNNQSRLKSPNTNALKSWVLPRSTVAQIVGENKEEEFVFLTYEDLPLEDHVVFAEKEGPECKYALALRYAEKSKEDLLKYAHETGFASDTAAQFFHGAEMDFLKKLDSIAADGYQRALELARSTNTFRDFISKQLHTNPLFEETVDHAVNWFIAAAESGHSKAKLWLDEYFERLLEGFSLNWRHPLLSCRHGGKITPNLIEYYERAAEKGSTEALYNLGNYYARKAKNVRRERKKIYKKARDYFTRALKLNDAWSELRIAEIYFWNLNDVTKALEHYIHATKQTVCSRTAKVAAVELGRIYSCGYYVVEKNSSEALKWWIFAAERGSEKAIFSLKHEYFERENVPNEEKSLALECLRKIAQKGSAFAQHMLDLIFDEGKGINKESKERVDALVRTQATRISLDEQPEPHLISIMQMLGAIDSLKLKIVNKKLRDFVNKLSNDLFKTFIYDEFTHHFCTKPQKSSNYYTQAGQLPSPLTNPKNLEEKRLRKDAQALETPLEYYRRMYTQLVLPFKRLAKRSPYSVIKTQQPDNPSDFDGLEVMQAVVRSGAEQLFLRLFKKLKLQTRNALIQRRFKISIPATDMLVEDVTLLHEAATTGNEALVDILLRNGARPEILDSTNASPLFVACVANSLEVVNLLLSDGRTLMMPLKTDSLRGEITSSTTIINGLSLRKPLLAAMYNENLIMIGNLLAAKAKVDKITYVLLQQFVKSPGLRSVLFRKFWEKSKADKTVQLNEVFLIATMGCKLSLLKDLISEGANIQAQLDSGFYGLRSGSNALHFFALGSEHQNEEDQAQVLNLLITEGGLDLETKDEVGRTPLVCAVGNGSKQAIKLLLDKGSNPWTLLQNQSAPVINILDYWFVFAIESSSDSYIPDLSNLQLILDKLKKQAEDNPDRHATLVEYLHKAIITGLEHFKILPNTYSVPHPSMSLLLEKYLSSLINTSEDFLLQAELQNSILPYLADRIESAKPALLQKDGYGNREHARKFIFVLLNIMETLSIDHYLSFASRFFSEIPENFLGEDLLNKKRILDQNRPIIISHPIPSLTQHLLSRSSSVNPPATMVTESESTNGMGSLNADYRLR